MGSEQSKSIKIMEQRLRRSTRLRTYRYPYCLCIIDVQTGFDNAHKVVNECAELVRQAVNDGAFIVVAQYITYEKTYSEITKLFQQVPRDQYGFCWANDNSKSHVITRLMFDNNVHTGDIVVCGINTGACVQSTVGNLSYDHPEKRITVLEDACADGSDFWHQEGLSTMKKYDNVYISSTDVHFRQIKE